MINNTLLSANTAGSKTLFNEFKQPQNGYYINTPFNEEEKNHKLGKTIALSALIAGFGTLALMKGGFSKTLAKYLDKWKVSLESKSIKQGKLQGTYRFMLKKVDAFLEKTQSINNITSLKDILVQKFMWGKNGEKTLTRKIHEGITKLFDNISRNTVNASYAKTGKKFASLNEYMNGLNTDILNQNKGNIKIKSAIERINTRMDRVNSEYERGFGINARNKRLANIRKATDGLYDYFWNASFKDIKNFKSKNMYQRFIAEDYMLPAKMKMSSDVELLRQAVTNDISDNCKAVTKAFDNIKKFVNPYDEKANYTLSTLRKNINKYQKLSGKHEKTEREALNKEIISNLKRLSDILSDSDYDKEAVKSMSGYISRIEDIISKNSKGELQEILTEYKKLLPRKEYLKLKGKVNGAINSLDKSINTETVNYVDKARDLRLGSAPTDVITIVTATGAVGWFTAKAKDKDQRISSLLRYGIPAIGAVSTSLFCTAKLVSGFKSMAFGLISGWLINKLGILLDDTRKKYKLDISLQSNPILKAQSDKV